MKQLRVFTRETLFELVWSEPIKTIAPRFELSDVGLKKACLRAGVPVPERGYWAKVAAGKSPPKGRLPPRDAGAKDIIEFGRELHIWPYDPEAELARPLPIEPHFPEPFDTLRDRVRKRVGKVPLARDISSLWGPLRKLIEEDERRRAKQMASSYFSSWDAPLFDSPFERRRLKVLSSIFQALARSGAKPHLRGKVGREITVAVGDTHVAVRLDHPKPKLDQWGQYQTRPGPVDVLRLTIAPDSDATNYQAAWSDTAESKLEKHLDEIVVDILIAGEELHRVGAQRIYEWAMERRTEHEAELVRRRAEVIRLAAERVAQEERRRRKMLFAQARDWRRAQDIRAFVADVLAEPSARLAADIDAWATWALAEADNIDPVRRGLEHPADGEPT